MTRKTKKQKPYVRRPRFTSNGWVVEVTEDRSPLAKVTESIPCGTSASHALATYHATKKELGQGH